MTNQELDAGTPVYDADGRWIGIVSLRNVPGPYLVVQKGRLFPRDISLPASAIAQIDEDGIVLRLSRSALKQGHHGRPHLEGEAGLET